MTNTPEFLPRVVPERRDGSERFHQDGATRDFDVHEFWAWSTSDLLSNATRGVLAEYIVGKAAGAVGTRDVRVEWDAFDLKTPEGVRIEVKSSAFIQSWKQARFTTPSFGISRAQSWNAETGKVLTEPERVADVYVFALLAHRDQNTIDPLDLSQWEFFVAPTKDLESRGSQQSIGLSSLVRLCGEGVGFDELAERIDLAARDQKS